MLHIRRIVWVCVEFWSRGMERCRHHLRYNLLSLDVISNITLKKISGTLDWRTLERTRSLAPRFKNRAPAKNRDRLAIIVIYTVRPYIERAAFVRIVMVAMRIVYILA